MLGSQAVGEFGQQVMMRVKRVLNECGMKSGDKLNLRFVCMIVQTKDVYEHESDKV